MTRWFTEYWGKGNSEIVDELGADDLAFSYPLHGELHGRESVKKMLTREAWSRYRWEAQPSR